MTASHEVAALRWRCRRGMRELDLLVGGWLDDCYADASPEERQGFGQLLEAPDPELYAWLMGRDRPTDPLLARVVDAIRAR